MSTNAKMRLRNKHLSQGWGQLVTPLLPQTEGGIRMRPSCNTLNEEATIRNFRIVQTEGARQLEGCNAPTVSKMETVGGDKGRGKKK
ncbi:MAG: hypothetical protein IK051_03965 [Rhodocyclaceae bacterium]|nr:hypothetical protein [Rhodocyclaceae bacterium]